ncbi:hypothetical protein IV45_GL001487 [Limosilactobacillus secaliphilus]|uniref:Uncharacterized protein n=2 Tax=Limosilactobacillus secaliphilus TaxID=396268 RepID=A0A0R2I2P3_9LACO|nr:hypothetical protein IV45_GL001487 [Limosilactobacillus secaliphilus]
MFAALGLIISVSWVAWGFLPMLAILLTTLIFGTIGYILDILGYSLNQLKNNILERLGE